MDTRDGLKVMLPNGWFLVRGSNTEPIIRVVVETGNETETRSIVATVRAQVEANINSRQ
jgi:phosphomannomutase